MYDLISTNKPLARERERSKASLLESLLLYKVIKCYPKATFADHIMQTFTMKIHLYFFTFNRSKRNVLLIPLNTKVDKRN